MLVVHRGKTIISNATRWDTFEAMMGEERLPPSEAAFRKRYQKSPSFLSIHMGVKAELLPEVGYVAHATHQRVRS